MMHIEWTEFLDAIVTPVLLPRSPLQSDRDSE